MVEVAVEQGKLKGKIGTDFTGKIYYSFQGIPYAKPPLGNLRFKDPQPAEPWEGTRDATVEGPGCTQLDPFQQKVIGNEDCLFLNVYTPQIMNNEDNFRKPVMFWIHGGGFSAGSGGAAIYGPDYLIANDIVLVTINYRVGVLGFLQLDDPTLQVPGNAGLKDIVMALRWVKTNIHNFCGNANNVTVFGESAGSASIQYLLLSPLSNGLFHKAILQSGSALNPWASGHQRNDLYSQALNIKTTNEKQILEILQKLSANEICDFQEKLQDNLLGGGGRPYGPSPEGASQNAFLPDDPINLLRSGNYYKVPLIIGHCNMEGILGLVWEPLHGRQPIHKDFENFVPCKFGLKRGSEESKRIAHRIKQFYYQNRVPSVESIQNYVELEGDAFFTHAIQKSIQNLVKNSKHPVYYYRFSFDGKHNFLKGFEQGIFKVAGACHADELGYLFKSQFQVEDLKNDMPEFLVMKRLTKLWTNFAKYGNPNSEESQSDLTIPNQETVKQSSVKRLTALWTDIAENGKTKPPKNDDVLNIEWKPVGSRGLNFLNIDKELSEGVNPNEERMNFWDQLYDDFSFAKFW